MALDYTPYQLTQAASTQIFQQHKDTLQNKPVQIQPGEFAFIHGDVYHRFQCPNKTAEIKLVADCWLDISIQGEGGL
ncbi:MAG: hypothetical protein GY696_07350 [Gammaproteobacteria bacterium]|nr:hypothetical protein [Gammaproteobacteria bacterium]